MSNYSGSDSDFSSDYANQSSNFVFIANLTPENMTESDKLRLVGTLQNHKVNTMTELRRIEKLAMCLDMKQFVEPLTSAWAHYVNSNNFLSELRGLTREYPFSSDLLDDGKWKVISDPGSSQSWNYAYLILKKIQAESLIKKHADDMAKDPSMWGGNAPDANSAAALSSVLEKEWTKAVQHMMKHWNASPPIMV